MQTLTNSSMNTYVICPRRFEYRYEKGLRRSETSDALRIGSMIHDGLDNLAHGYSLDNVFSIILNNYETMLGMACGDDHATKILVEAEMCFRMIQGYAEHWADDQIEVIDSEVSFRVPIRNPDSNHDRAKSKIYERSGVIDKIIRRHGRKGIMEHKTSSSDIGPNSDYWARLRIDPQVSGYLLGAKTHDPEIDFILYDVLRKPGIRPKKLTKASLKEWLATGKYCGEEFGYDGTISVETPRMYGARLIQTIREDPDRYYQRQEIARLTSDLVDYKQDVWSLTKQIRESQRRGHWYRNSMACIQPFRCEYADICLGGLSPERAAEDVPVGFEIVEDVHPELRRENEYIQ